VAYAAAVTRVPRLKEKSAADLGMAWAPATPDLSAKNLRQIILISRKVSVPLKDIIGETVDRFELSSRYISY